MEEMIKKGLDVYKVYSKYSIKIILTFNEDIDRQFRVILKMSVVKVVVVSN